MRSPVVIALAVACSIVSGCDRTPSPPRQTLNDPKDSNTAWRTGTPLSYQDAIKNGHCPIALPSEARNIQFVDFYAGFGGFSQHVRFEAPVETCREHAKRVLNAYNSKVTANFQRVRTSPAPLIPEHVQSVARSARSGQVVSRAAWFDIDEIQTGEAWGDDSGRGPVVFVDTERGIFYFRCTD